jgi:hypothetical protein
MPEKLLYAPMTDVGAIVYDTDAVVMEVGAATTLPEALRGLQAPEVPALRLFSGSTAVSNEDFDAAESGYV